MTQQPIGNQIDAKLEQAGDGIDHLSRSIEHAMDKGQSVAERAVAGVVADVHDGMRALRTQAAPLIDQTAETLGQAADLTRAGIEHAREAGERLSKDARALAASAVGYIRTQPVKAMLVAAGAGASLIIALRLLAGSNAKR